MAHHTTSPPLSAAIVSPKDFPPAIEFFAVPYKPIPSPVLSPFTTPSSSSTSLSPDLRDEYTAASTKRTWPQSERASPRSSPAPSPNGLRARQNSAPVQPMALPLPAGVSAMSDALNNQQRQPSLMRRVSQKAANKLRRRTSSTSHDHEERSGPVLMRHRSASQSGGDGPRLGLGIQQDDSLDDEEEAQAAVSDSAVVVGTDNDGEGSSASVNAKSAAKQILQPNVALPRETMEEEQDITEGVVVPQVLQTGTLLTRVTRKKTTQRLFKLDVTSARVSWDPNKQSSRFYVDDIKEIRTGTDARNHREEFQISQEYENRWATIVYGDAEDSGKHKTLHLIAPDVETFTKWTITLERILRYRTEMMAGLAMQGEKFVDAHWRNYMSSQQASAQATKEEHLSFEDVEHLCRRLHVNCSKRFLKEKFKRADRDNSGYLNFMEFRRFVKLLKEREEIKELWKNVVVNQELGMTRIEFRGFLRDIQKVDVDGDSAHVDKVFRKFCRQASKTHQATEGSLRALAQLHAHPPPVDDEMRMSREAFADFLLSASYNPPLQAITKEEDLDRPLNEYFISSSHNTYLLGRQVRGESSVEGYIRTLQRGCRCLEIDCWDGDDGRPIVTHGRTGTSEVLFSDVIAVIGKYAFMASPLPLILSLEVHCGLEQQVKMAELMTSILGEKLVTKPFMTNTFILPTPQELKYRILIKVKGNERSETLDVDNRSGGAVSGASSKSSSFIKGMSSTSTTSTSETDESSGNGTKKEKRPKVSTKMAFELGALGVYCRGQKFRNFALPESKTFNHVFSFQEKSFLKFCKDPEKKVQLEKHNLRYLLRVYPSGFRVNSSNFDPLGFWRRGVQMVALNWQTYDLGMQLNDAMFASANDRCGYVLKPKELRGSRTTFDPPQDVAAAKLKKERKGVKFSIDVISAQQLSRPKDRKADPIDPFVEVEVFSADDKAKGASTSEGGIDTSESKGLSGLGAPQKRRTKTIKDDGFHPLFNEKMSFNLVTKFESLVFVRFSVYTAEGADSNDKTLIATYTAKLSSLQQGYRHLPLFDVQGEQFLFSTLFVKIHVDPIVHVDRDMPERTSTMTNLKTTAISMLNRGRSVRRKSGKKSGSESTVEVRQTSPTAPGDQASTAMPRPGGIAVVPDK